VSLFFHPVSSQIPPDVTTFLADDPLTNSPVLQHLAICLAPWKAAASPKFRIEAALPEELAPFSAVIVALTFPDLHVVLAVPNELARDVAVQVARNAQEFFPGGPRQVSTVLSTDAEEPTIFVVKGKNPLLAVDCEASSNFVMILDRVTKHEGVVTKGWLFVSSLHTLKRPKRSRCGIRSLLSDVTNLASPGQQASTRRSPSRRCRQFCCRYVLFFFFGMVF
jgi:hypothetical protein